MGAILLLGVSFILLVIAAANLDYGYSTSRRRLVIIGATLWQTILVVTTEVLGAFRILDRTSLVIVWSGVIIGLLGWLGWRKNQKHLIIPMWADLPRLVKNNLWFSGITAFFLFVEFVVAVSAPPNTGDSLAYHLPRVMHWLQNHSLNHYYTPIAHQLWNPIGAEVILLHLIALGNGDRFVNLAQWFSQVGALSSVSLIAQQLGMNKQGQQVTVLVVLTLPMGILQATSTQNDYVLAFWIITVVCWVIEATQRPLRWREWLWLSLGVGHAVLTKGTAFAYLFPILVWLGWMTYKRGGLKFVLTYALFGALIVGVINIGHWLRNYGTYRNPLAPQSALRFHVNQLLTPPAIISIASRNLVSQFAFPTNILQNWQIHALELLHQGLGLSLNDERTSMKDFSLVYSPRSEDYSGNPIHLLTLFIAWGYITFSRSARFSSTTKSYAWILAAVFTLFSTVYKWQPWGSRLLLPFFIVSAPLIALGLYDWPRSWRKITIILMLLYSLPALLMTSNRPLIPIQGFSVFTTPRQTLLLVNSPEKQEAYYTFADLVKNNECKHVGLVLTPNDLEYPIWAFLSPTAQEVYIEHVQLEDISGDKGPGSKTCALFIADETLPESVLQGFRLVAKYLRFRLFIAEVN